MRTPSLGVYHLIRLVLPFATPSLNQTQRMHWGRRRKLAASWSFAIAASSYTFAKRATGKRKVTIERHGKKQLDKDNAYGGVKVIVDALKNLGLILDDDAANLDLEVTQATLAKGERPHTVITLEDVT